MPDAVNVRDLHQVTLDQDLEMGRGLEHSEHGVEGIHVREAGATTGPRQLVGDIAGRRNGVGAICACRESAGCSCRAGCPACVGPILASEEDAERTPRQLAARVIDLLMHASQQPA